MRRTVEYIPAAHGIPGTGRRPRVLLSGYQPIFVDVVARLYGRGNVDIVALVTECSLADKAGLQGVHIFDRKAFTNADRIERLNLGSEAAAVEPLSGKIMQDFVACEREFLALSDRWSVGLTVWERRRFYRELLLFWYRYLESLEVDAVMLDGIPHSGWNNVMEAVARHLGIPVIMLDYTPIPDRVIFFDDYRQVEKVPVDFMADRSLEELDAALHPQLREQFATSSPALNEVRKTIRGTLRRPTALDRVGRLARRAATGLAALSHELRDRKFFRRRGLLPLNQKKNVFVNKAIAASLRAKLKRLRRYYCERTTPIDRSRPFAVFMLHYQPEVTTLPAGGFFEDQILAVRILSAAMPEGWLLYVKEHPVQFSGPITCAIVRDEHFYDELAAMKNVRLVDLAEDSHQLIEDAQVVGTITGDVGWEALVRSRSIIAFGAPWYSGCNSCYTVQSVAECRAAVDAIRRATPADVARDVRRFLVFLQGSLVIAARSSIDADLSSRPYSELVENYAEAVEQRVAAACFHGRSKQASVRGSDAAP